MSNPVRFHPLVSIVIPVYNGANYLREAIDSALAQTYQNIEVIVVNDGSKDDGATDAIACSYGDKIRYFVKDNGGTSTALNVGLKNMNGEYFSWLSHDDTYYPDKTKIEIDVLAGMENKRTVIMSDLDAIDENYKKLYKTNYKLHRDEYPLREKSNIYPVIYMQLHGCTLLIARACFDDVGFFDEDCLVAQDFELFNRVLARFPHYLVSKVLVTARDSSNRQGRRSKVRGSLEYSNLFISIIESLTEEDVLLLAPGRLDFYQDMRNMFRANGYVEAFAYINKKMMNSLHINYTDLQGGNFNGYDLHLSLRKRGFDSSQLVFKRDSNDESTHSLRSAHDLNVIYNYIERLESNYNLRSLLSPFSYDIMFSKVFQEAEIIHYHIIHHPAFNITLLPLLTMLKPSVWTLHDPWALGGHCVHHDECQKWKEHCLDCENLNATFSISSDTSALQFEIKKQAVQNSKLHCIVASKWMEEKVQQSPIFKGKTIHRIPFGIDQSVFKPGNLHDAKRKLGVNSEEVVLFVRIQSVFKGLDLLIDALDNLIVTKKVTILTVGETGLLHRFSGKYTIKEFGWINDLNKLVELFQACDLFLMPSEQETFGMMAIEAMSCGKMVLALSGTALPEIINAPHCGIAVEKNKYWVELQRLLSSPDEVADRGSLSLIYAQEHYNYDIYISKMLEVYQKVIQDFEISHSGRLVLEQLKKHNFIPQQLIAINSFENLSPQMYNFKTYYARIETYYKKYGARQTFRKLRDKIQGKLIKICAA